jgi:hypothetical protein
MKLHHWRNPTKAVRESHISFFQYDTPVIRRSNSRTQGRDCEEQNHHLSRIGKIPPVGAMIVLGSSSSGFPFHLTIDYTDLPF